MAGKQKKRFLITGGSKGIGASIVEQARKDGHDVVFTGRDEEALAHVARDTGALSIQAEITEPRDNARVVEFAKDKMGGIDVLINNAAIGYGAPIGEIDMKKLMELFDVNIFGLVDLTNRVVPVMKAEGRGDIVNVASTSGMKGHANGTAYSGSKWALRGITQCWQAELRRHDIRVTCICPSEVQTGWGGKRPGDNPSKLFSEDIAQAILSALELHPRGFIPEFAVFATNPS